MAASFDIERLQKILRETESNLRKIPQLKKVQKATGVKIVYILLGAFVLSLVLIYVFSGLRALSMLVGTLYPGWASLKAIKSKDKEDDTFWLSYWVVFGIFSAFESITDILLFWIPFYELLKICFYFYLFSPQLKGALTMYVMSYLHYSDKSLLCVCYRYYALLEPLVGKLAKAEANVVEAAQSVKSSISNSVKDR